MTDSTLALLAFLFPLAYSPGPGNMVFAANGARFGIRATVPANAGYHLATWGVTAAIGFGFAAAMARTPAILEIIRWGGCGYVLYLAWGFLHAGPADKGAKARPAGFFDGVVLLLLNPKAYLIIALMFSQFLIGVGQDPVAAVLWISTVFTLNNLGAFLVWTVIGDRIAARWRDAAGARALNRACAAMLAGVALWILLG